MHYTATYSPEDNKLRLYASSRLDAETYNRVKAAGFKWAPKQDLFVAPMWTPSREDLLIELAGEIEDEDKSLVERAEERADRFGEYKESRIEDAQSAEAGVRRIADNIPFGQPILVGHHSERHARKDAERIQNGMRKTIQMWQTARYWEQRAAGALRHAKYKELPAVRHRRIKGLQADQRKQQKFIDEAAMWFKLWTDCSNEQDKDLQAKVALRLAGMCNLHLPRKEGDKEDFNYRPTAYDALTNAHPSLYAPRTLEDVLKSATSPNTYPAAISRAQRWLDHYTNRIAYEKAMLGEAGGLAADAFHFEVGGKVLIGDEWLVILKINKTGDGISSLTTTPRRHFYGTKYKADIETVKGYEVPKPEETAAVKEAAKLPPMCNYPGEGFKHMSTDEWKRKKMSDVPQSTKHAATDTHGAHRTRSTWGGNWKTVPVYLTDSKRIDPPAKAPLTTSPAADTLAVMAHQLKAQNPVPAASRPAQRDERIPSHEDLHAMKAAAHGVAVVIVPQLFPTPPELAARMVALAEIQSGNTVLEPSAGTGALLDAIRHDAADSVDLTAVEINEALTGIINKARKVHYRDFLACGAELGRFDRILMNPPFANGADIKHIEHALSMLNPGGRLVAICANGPRQNDRLRPLVESYGGDWEVLPTGTFASQGTGVNTVLFTISTEPLDANTHSDSEEDTYQSTLAHSEPSLFTL